MLQGKRFCDPFKLDHYVVATDLLRGQPVVFSRETFPELKVSRAARFSIGIPLFYSYQKFQISPEERGIMVDGNLASFVMGNMFHDDEHSTEDGEVEQTFGYHRCTGRDDVRYREQEGQEAGASETERGVPETPREESQSAEEQNPEDGSPVE